MNILYVSASELPSKNANSVHVMKMCAALAQEGNDVKLIGIKGNDETADLYRYYSVSNNFKVVLTSHSIVERIKIIFKSVLDSDLVYTRWPIGAFVSSNLLRCKTIMEYHSMPSNSFISFLVRLNQNKRIVGNAYITNILKNEYEKNFKMRNGIVIPDGADATTDSNPEVEYFSNKMACCYVGSFLPGKGIETVVEVASLMPDIEFHIVGGDEESIEYYKQKSGTNIIWHGFLPQEQIRPITTQCQVGLLPNKPAVLVDGHKNIGEWTSPLKMFEYMASKKAIIASNIPVLKEVLHNEKNCLMVDPNSIEEWVNAIEKLDKDRKLMERIANNAFTELIEKYSWSIRAKTIIRFINERL